MVYTKSIIDNYLKSFEEILGLSLTINNTKISAVNLPKAILKVNSRSINHVIKPLESLFIEEEEHIKSSRNPNLYKQVLITKYIYSLIDNELKYDRLDDFINKLQSISNKTYEQQSCQMGFILFKKAEDNITVELNKLGMDYLPFDAPIFLENIDKNKQALKLIDSLSLSYVVNNSYNIVGIAKKRKSQQSISSIMANRHNKAEEALFKLYMYQYFITFNSKNRLSDETEQIKTQLEQLEEQYITLKEHEPNGLTIENLSNQIEELNVKLISAMEEENKTSKDWLNGYDIISAEKEKILNFKNNIQFIQIGSRKVEWFISSSLVCMLSNGKWSIRNNELINHIILEFLLRQYPTKEDFSSEDYIKVLNQILPRAKLLYSNISQLSNKNIGALIVILQQNKKQKRSIYKELLSKEKLNVNEYTKVIRTESKTALNIYSCDTYLFELLASIDGAILLDRQFNILSFGEMINNSIKTPDVAEAGSRTLAAAKASVFGLSIKVSEDGDISIFEDGSPVIKL